MKPDVYDSIIIGAGPAGIAVANTFKKNNIKYLVFERNFIASNIARFPVNMTFFSNRFLLEIDDFPLAIPEEKPSREQYLTYIFHFVRSRKLNISDYSKVVSIIKPEKSESGCFEIHVNYKNGKTEKVLSKTVVTACGAFDDPRLLNIPGEDLPHVSHYFTEVFPYLNHSVLVIGSGNSAVEVALKLFRAGCKVGMSYRSECLSSTKIKYWMYPDIQKRLEKNEILHLPGANLSQIKNQSVILTDKNGNIRELEFDFVLAMTGYNPPVGFLKKLEIELEPETNIPVHDPVTLETPTPGVFVAGVITGGNISGKVFIENSRNHGEMILPRLNEILK
jgi:thioredoxin reductase (NADPH)